MHATPPQLLGVVVAVSQPSASGAKAPLQSAKPGLQVNPQRVPSQVAADAWVRLQLTLQLPQVVMLEPELSQPSVFGARVLLQSKKPGLHVNPHEVPLHVAIAAFIRPQLLLQPPQVDVLDREASQPSVFGATEPSQSAKPGMHVKPQDVPSQLAIDAWFSPQLTLHAPQLFTVDVSVSQPFVFGAAVMQSAKPGMHVKPQENPLQVAIAAWSRPQLMLQLPHVAGRRSRPRTRRLLGDHNRRNLACSSASRCRRYRWR